MFLTVIDIVNPSSEKVTEMLDYCLDSRVHLAKFSEHYIADGVSVASFHFSDTEFALAFKLKFL